MQLNLFGPEAISEILAECSAETRHSPVFPLNTRAAALSREIAFLAYEPGLLPSPGGAW